MTELQIHGFYNLALCIGVVICFGLGCIFGGQR